MLSLSLRNNFDDGLVITRRRKKYKFARFDELSNTFQFSGWVVRGVIASAAKQSSNNLSGLPRQTSLPRNDNDRSARDDGVRLIVEIGAGTGLFSVEMARRHPENFYVAVDIKSDRMYTGAKLADELGLGNVVFVRGDIWRLGEMFASGSVAEIWVTFPDPYASEDQTRLKKSDAKHRLTHARFLEIYKQVLSSHCERSEAIQPNNNLDRHADKSARDDTRGMLHFKTDNQPLFDWSAEQFEQNGWKITEQTNDLHGSDLSEDYKIKTSYEARFTEQGLPIFYLTATILP
jgi:tRNA (guanine-N7-)-methyltransferase